MLPLLLTGVAAAADVPVLVSALQPRNAEAKKLATLIESFIADKLAETDGIRVLRVEDTPKFTDYDARIYIDSCPPMQIVGCSLIVAERGEAPWAVTGSVQALASSSKVEISIIDVEDSRVVVSFASELGSGDDEAFAEGVAKVLVAAIKGEVGQEADIREDAEGPKRSKEENAAVAAELEALEREIGDVTTSLSRDDEEIVRPTYTAEDISRQMETDATKPWETVGMGPAEYLAYKNSGMQLVEWRKRALGRKGQLLLRVGGGVVYGPVNSAWYGRYQLDPTTLAVVDAYAAQAPQSATGAIFGGGIAYGILPILELAVQGGIVPATIGATSGHEKAGETPEIDPEQTDDAWVPWASARVVIAPFPTLPARPVFAVGGIWMSGASIYEHEYDYSGIPSGELDTDKSAFAKPNLLGAEIMVGGEVRVGERIDLFLHVPVDLWLTGTDLVELRSGTGAGMTDLDPPEAAGIVGAGAQFGLQVRLGGAKPRESSILDELEEIEEE